MIKTPTEKQIRAEIKVLESYRNRLILPGTLANNRALIEAQIDVLKGKLSHDEIYDRWPDDERDLEIRCDAMDAHDWMVGVNKKNKPSKEWKELLIIPA